LRGLLARRVRLLIDAADAEAESIAAKKEKEKRGGKK
jgi:hypothetical protein